LKRGRISEMREPLPQSIRYLRVCGPLTCRHQKETRCLPVCVVKRACSSASNAGCVCVACALPPCVCGKARLQLGEQRWLRLRSLPRGARPLLLRSRLLAFLCCASPLRLFARATVLKRGRISEMQKPLPCQPWLIKAIQSV
jgi:hypothetical protein